MKNQSKKIIAFLMTITLVYATVLPIFSLTFAEEMGSTITQNDVANALETIIPDMLQTVANTPEALGLTDKVLADAYVGASFRIAEYRNDEANQKKDILYFPVVANENMVALITLVKQENEINASVGIDFAPQLNQYLNETGSSAALLSSSQNIYGVSSSGQIETVFQCGEDNKDELFSTSRARGGSTASLFDQVSMEDNRVSKVVLQQETCKVPLKQNTQARGATAYKYLNYPIVYQNGMNICWAAASAAIVMHEMPSKYPELYATSVCKKIGHDYTGGSMDDVIKALRAYLPSIYVPTSYKYAMSVKDVQIIINNVDPAYMSSHQVNGSSRHGVSLCGYAWYGSTFQIRIMDTSYACFKFSTYSNSKFRFAYGNDQYEWDSTVRLLYRS